MSQRPLQIIRHPLQPYRSLEEGGKGEEQPEHISLPVRRFKVETRLSFIEDGSYGQLLSGESSATECGVPKRKTLTQRIDGT